MGITYRAQDLTLGSPVALKIISARYYGDPETRERFRREARAAAQLRHPNVARVFHFGETHAGRCFYAMELVEGETVEAHVRRNRPSPRSLHWKSLPKSPARSSPQRRMGWCIGI